MLEKIIDKYFMKKIAIILIERTRLLMDLDFLYVPLKDKAEIYVNYTETRKRLQEYRKVCVINRYDVISAISDFNKYEREFREKVEYALKEK